jgi:hypothetical protein
MIEVKNFSAPFLEVEVVHKSGRHVVKVFGVMRLDDMLLDSIQALVSRHGFAEGVRDWVHLNGLQMVSVVEMESDDIESKLFGKPSLYAIYIMLKKKRPGQFLTYGEIARGLNKAVTDRTISTYLNRIATITGKDLDNPSGQKKVRLPV